jgi:hypothetical protein
MANIDKLLQEMRNNPRGVRFSVLKKVCIHYFGEPRINGSHHFFSTPWQGQPLVNIQDIQGMGKPYQIKQVIAAIVKLIGENDV